MYRQIRNLEVYAAASVIQEWSLEYGGREIKGQPTPGDVAIKAKNNVLQIYILQRCFSESCPPYDLIEQLSRFCGIQKAEHKTLLLYILSHNNHNKIIELLEKDGIASLKPGEELPDGQDNGWEPAKPPRKFASPFPSELGHGGLANHAGDLMRARISALADQLFMENIRVFCSINGRESDDLPPRRI
jgi:hypothetical protein